MALPSVILAVPLYINHESLYPIVERFFDSVKKHYPELYKTMVVIDDASPLPHDFKWHHKLHYENQGFTATANECLKTAFFYDPDIVILANDDLEFKAGDLDRFFELDPDKPIIASPMDTSASNDDRFGAIWGITRTAWKQLGPLDERYKHFASDRDYYDRAVKNGVEIIKWRDIVIDHPESSTYKHVDKDILLKADLAEFLKNNQT